MRKISWLIVVMALAVGFVPSDANFVQCFGGVCDGTDGATEDADLINGSPIDDTIVSLGGNDVIFANDGNDIISGIEGDDLAFGGAGSDEFNGGLGNDILLLGPDVLGQGQRAFGANDNDTTIVFVGEVSECLVIDDAGGLDVAHLIGFGPYIATQPFGPHGFNDSWLYIVDPIAGGDILIDLPDGDDVGIETVNGLPTPDPTIVPGDHPAVVDCINILVP